MVWKLFCKENVINESSFYFAKHILTGKRVVIADDNGGTLKWLKFTLQDYNVEVATFKHGKETIEFLVQEQSGSNPIDILLLDIHMNKIGGLEIARYNAQIKNPAKVIFLTGCAEDSMEYLEAKQSAIVIQKPASMDYILGLLIKCFVGDIDVSYEEYIKDASSD